MPGLLPTAAITPVSSNPHPLSSILAIFLWAVLLAQTESGFLLRAPTVPNALHHPSLIKW